VPGLTELQADLAMTFYCQRDASKVKLHVNSEDFEQGLKALCGQELVEPNDNVT
jgi:hypothetical protein